MQDRVPLYPGRVKLTPVAGQENTYDMVRADQPTQDGTPLNKDSLLKDTTASLYGLGVDAVPDDALVVLSRFQKGLGNEYVWSKTKLEDVHKYNTNTETNYVSGTAVSWYYSDSFHVDGNQFVLDNPQTVPIAVSSQNVVRGKYVYSAPSGVNLLKIPEDAVFTTASADTIQISSIVRLTDARSVEESVVYGYVNSPDPSAYPPAVSDGYTYTALGQLGSKVRIATGSYKGTGKYGIDNPNTLTFNFVPKIVMLTGQQNIPYGTPGTYTSMPYVDCEVIERTTVGMFSWCGFELGEGYRSECYAAFDRGTKTLRWASSDSAGKQYNNISYKYYYIALG